MVRLIQLMRPSHPPDNGLGSLVEWHTLLFTNVLET